MSISASHRIGLVSILVALPFISLTGLFGKFLTISPLLIVQGRTVFAFSILLIVLIFLRKKILLRNYYDWFWLIFSGSILGLHWVAFFEAIQISTVAIGLLSFASYPLFTTILEPLFFKEALRRKNIFSALIVICGLIIISTSSEDQNSIFVGSVANGLLWGICSGLGFALLTLLNRFHVQNHSPLLITLWQNGFAAMILLPWSFLEEWEISLNELGLLFILGVICTGAGHSLLIYGLRHLKAQFVSLMIAGLEPVLAIIFALLILDEIPSLQTLIGGLLILGTTFIVAYKTN